MEDIYFITSVLILISFSGILLSKLYVRKKNGKIDYSRVELYSGKTYSDICQNIGSPFLSEKQLSGFKSTWLLDDQRITLCFDENLLFSSLLSLSKLPKAVKKLSFNKKSRLT